jgi:limonene 1,2-monooxygenase
MTRGRVMFGAGPGLLASDALMMGIEPEDTRRRMAEGIDVILRLFRGDFVTEQTDWYTMRDAHTHLRPYTSPHPEVCVASAVTPSGGRMAGTYDLGMLCVAAGERAGFDALASNWQVACEIAAEHGRDMDRSRLRCVLQMHLADTREQAAENIRWGCEENIRYFNNNQPRFDVPEGADYVDWVMEHRLAVVGTPDDAIARIERLYAKQGEFGAVLLQINNWTDWPAIRRSLELYAQYVIPHFAHANENRMRSYEWVTKNQQELVQKRVDAAQQMIAQHEAERGAAASPAGGASTSTSLS